MAYELICSATLAHWQRHLYFSNAAAKGLKRRYKGCKVPLQRR